MPAASITSRPIVEMIKYIRSLDIRKPVWLLEADGGYDCLLGSNFVVVAPWYKGGGFNAFRAATRTNMIVLSDGLRSDSRIRKDPEWLAFLEHSTENGYSVMPVPGADRKVIVDGSLLGAGAP